MATRHAPPRTGRPGPRDARAVLAMQRTAGNRAVALMQKAAAGAPVAAVAVAPATSAQVTSEPAEAAVLVGSDPTVPVGSEPTTHGATAVGLTEAPSPVQREDDPGLLARIRRRISGVSDVLRSGWAGVAQRADGALSRVRSGGAAALTAITRAGARVTALAQAGWQRARGAIATVGALGQRLVGAAAGGLPAAFGRLRRAVVALDADALAGAWSAILGTITGAAGRAAGVGRLVAGRVGAAWTALRSGFTAGLGAARRGVHGVVGRLGGLGRATLVGASAAWRAVSGRAASLSRLGGAVARRLVAPLVSSARNLWGSLQTRWAAARRAVTGAAARATTAARSAWARTARAASAAFDRVRATAHRAGQAATGAVRRLAGRLRSAAQRFRRLGIGGLVAKVRTYSRTIGAVRTATADPTAVMTPFVAPVVAQLAAGMPAAAETAAREHLPPGAAARARPAAAGLAVQRNGATTAPATAARSTAGGAEIWAGLLAAFAEKWAALDPWQMVKDVLVGIVWPWPKIGEELIGIGTDMVTAAGTLYLPRNPLTDLAGCLHDLWSNAMKLLDFPLVLWRRVNNIGMLLLGPVTIALTIIGAVGGSLAGTVLGAIAGFLAGLGIGAAPGAGGGLAVGGVAGAGAGFGVALGIGQVVLVSFVAGEVASLVKVLLDLFTTRQTREEKAADFHTAADSSLALGITAVLVALGWIGGRVAAAAVGLLRRITPRSVLAVIDDFAGGVRTAREGGVPEDHRPRDSSPVEVPGRQRLQTEVDGSRRFADRIGEVIETVERPGARPALETRLRAALDELARIETELRAARSPADVERLGARRAQVQRELTRLNKDARAAVSRYPDSWRDFNERHHAEFEAELGAFRGSPDLQPTPGLRGGEGQLFRGPNPEQALKRWFRARQGDMAQSVRLLREARSAVRSNARLREVVDVVEVSRTGSDWVQRGFSPDSVPLGRVADDVVVAAVRTEALAALEGSTSSTLQLLRRKLVVNSENLHWDPARRKILVIDMQ